MAKKRKQVKNDSLLLVAHGDLDGIVSAVLASSWSRVKDYRFIRVAFVQPFTLDEVKVADDEDIIVCDIAVNNRDPRMTESFISRLGDQLLWWYDHHRGWERLEIDDKRFVIDSTAPSCAEVVLGTAQSEGLEPEGYALDLVAAATVADSRQGELHEWALLVEKAIKADLSDNEVRKAAYEWLSGHRVDQNHRSVLSEASNKYEVVLKNTEELAKSYQVSETGKTALVKIADISNIDMTQLLLAGQRLAPFAVVFGWFGPNGRSGSITIATSRKDVNLVKLFGLPSGAPFRVSLSTERLDEVLKKLNEI